MALSNTLLNQNLIVHRTKCQTILPPQLRLFGTSSHPLTDSYYDPTNGAIISSNTLLNPLKLEFSFHLCSKLFRQDLLCVFPDLKSHQNVYVIPTIQPIGADMSAFTFENGELKDHMLSNSVSLLCTLRQLIYTRAFELSIPFDAIFFDGTEPSSGLPYFSTCTSSVYSEVQGACSLLKYRTEQAGSCSLLKHPLYGFSCYPTTFLLAGDFPLDELYQILIQISHNTIELGDGVVGANDIDQNDGDMCVNCPSLSSSTLPLSISSSSSTDTL